MDGIIEDSYKPLVIDTGLDAINETIGGYIVGDMRLICIVYEDEKDKEEFLSRTLNAFSRLEIPAIYISPKGEENNITQLKNITYIEAPVAVYIQDLRKQIRDLIRLYQQKIIIVEDVTKINSIHPELLSREIVTRHEIGFCLSVHRISVIGLEFNIPVLVTIPEMSFSTYKDGNGVGAESNCGVIIKLERENGKLKPIVTKNSYGRIS